MSVLHMSLSIPTPLNSLSSSKTLSYNPLLPLTTKLSQLSLKTTPIRMGGGPRTYPGGVSKWQWKRMQAKKAKQLLKARLARERQIYEMRKRAELKAAVSELERPWESVEKPPNLFSVSADEQLKVLADRFQKPGGLDLWSERDGPELFRTDNGLPSSRFFPKGVVHSVRPYGKVGEQSGVREEFEGLICNGVISGSDRKMDVGRSLESVEKQGKSGIFSKEKVKKKGNRRMHLSGSEGKNSSDVGFSNRNRGSRRVNSNERSGNTNSEVFDMSLQNDGSYGFEL